MALEQAATEISISGIEPVYRGKVRDIYDLGDKLLMVTTDRLSAFDVVFKEGVPGRGKILTGISCRWFDLLKNTVSSHILETDISRMPAPFCDNKELLDGRTMLVKKARRIDFECIVRGYLMGSGFEEYKKSGTVAGQPLPEGLKSGSPLPEPLFTPSTKADSGHDINITYQQLEKEAGSELASKLKELSLSIFNYASTLLLQHGIILADTKFEFGYDGDQIILIDEVLTPDSSRYWKKEEYDKAMETGEAVPSMDKQIVRDYLNTLDWDKTPPPPEIPNEIIEKTLAKYKEIEKVIQCITPEK